MGVCAFGNDAEEIGCGCGYVLYSAVLVNRTSAVGLRSGMPKVRYQLLVFVV